LPRLVHLLLVNEGVQLHVRVSANTVYDVNYNW